MPLKNLKGVLIRTEGSHKLGIGHLMRCLALAEGLKARGIRPVFVSRNYDGDIGRLIRDNSYKVEEIPGRIAFKDEAPLVLKLAERYGTDVVIIDMLHSDMLKKISAYRNYLKALKESGKFILAIGTCSKRLFNNSGGSSPDLNIIPYFGAEKLHHPDNGLLLGPDYFIFRGEFIRAAKVKRGINKVARNILISMGGSDPFGLTIKIVRALAGTRLPGINLKIVLGPAFSLPIRRKLQKSLTGFKGNFQLIDAADNMAELMLWSDLVITSSGLTKYEAAVTGTPCIVVSYSGPQAELMDQFKKSGAMMHLGEGAKLKNKEILRATESVLNNRPLRKRMSASGKRLVDGRGVERIIAKIPKELL